MVWPDIQPPNASQIQTQFRHPPPHDKDIEISLLYFMPMNCYQVKTITNTTWYKPGEWLSEAITAQICALPKWKVSIDSYEWVQKLLGVVGNFVHIP